MQLLTLKKSLAAAASFPSGFCIPNSWVGGVVGSLSLPAFSTICGNPVLVVAGFHGQTTLGSEGLADHGIYYRQLKCYKVLAVPKASVGL